MASWVLLWDGFWCFNSSTVYKLTFSLFGCWAFSTYSECNKNWALTSQSVAGCVRSSFLEAIVGSPKADASKIDPWLKGPAENHRATEGAPCSFVNVWCLFDVCTILAGDSPSWGGDSTSCPVHLGVSKGWHCLGWKQTSHRHIALAFWSTCLRITSYHVWHDITWLWQKHWIFLGELLYELWILAMWYPLYIPLVLPWQAEAEGLEQWKELMHLICSLESSLVSLEKNVQFILPFFKSPRQQIQFMDVYGYYIV